MTTWRNVGILAALSIASTACSRAGEPTSSAASVVGDVTVGSSRSLNPGGPGSAVRGYETFDGCESFLGWTKDQLLERVTPYGIDPYGWGPDRWPLDMPMEDVVADTMAASESAATEAPAMTVDADRSAAAPEAPVESAPGDQTSTTNTQEFGVDEGDLAETDGRFVYSILDNVLRSVDLATSTLVAEIPLPIVDAGQQPEMILVADTLLVVWPDWSSSAGETVAARYSLTDGLPTFTGATHLEGTPVSVRSVGGIARITMTTQLTDRIDFVQPRYGLDGDESEDEVLEPNRAVINALTADDLLPRRYDQAANGTRGKVEAALECDLVGHPDQFAGFGLTWIASLDLTGAEPEPIGSGGIVADAQTVYVSTEHLYIAGQTDTWPVLADGLIPVQPDDPTTAIHAFDIADPARTTYLASGEVPGALLNSYSMSEFDGVLRVATTEWSSDFGGGQDSGVHILRQEQGELVEVGAVRGLGHGEQIQAVRFHGPIGYVVTFRRTDPLFVLDLSDPTDPTLSGELKLPGYSSYLHPIGGGLVLGVGFSGTENGLDGRTQLSLFDVADPAKPTLVTSLDLGLLAEAAWDPHAFLWWPETGSVLLPKELVCDDANDLSACSSLVVAHVDVATRTLSETTRLFQWFPIRRALVASGDLVTVSAGGLKQWSFDGFHELADVRFDIPNTTAEDTLP